MVDFSNNESVMQIFGVFFVASLAELLNNANINQIELPNHIPTLPVPEIKALSLTKLQTSGGRRNM